MNTNSNVLALAGNPNVGKSTLFNALTGLHQHTGNWPGKTVALAQGETKIKETTYNIIDLPGCYRLQGGSPEEQIAENYLKSSEASVCIIVCDATALERNLILALEILGLGVPSVLCLSLTDEAKRKGIVIDQDKLQDMLGIPVVAAGGRQKKSLPPLKDAITQALEHSQAPALVDAPQEKRGAAAVAGAAYIAAACVQHTREYKVSPADKILTGKFTAFPSLLLLLGLIFWLTMVGANYPSAWLQKGLFWLEEVLYQASLEIGLPIWLCQAVWRGMYRVTAWVVSVMLPPMAIFFPLFTLMEDMGLLPRIAFDLDRGFQGCKACGKQSLCMMMGLGCNAAGVVGCRIIDSRRQRLIEMVTNAFMPCNGRLPTLITLLGVLTLGAGAASGLWAAASLAALLILALAATLLASRLLSRTLLKGQASPLILELPPFRRPAVGQILVRSLLDRTLFVLARAIKVAAPAGLLIWCLANIHLGEQNLMTILSDFLDPVGKILGMDGVILLAFILGLPAGEIVLPLILMGYTGGGVLQAASGAADIAAILAAHGWTTQTVICVLLFCLMHWPCSTTLITIQKESGSWRWSALAALLPTLFGVVSCLLVNLIL